MVVWPGWTESGIHTLHLVGVAETTVAGVWPPIRTALELGPKLLPTMSARQAGERRLSCDAAFTTLAILGICAKRAQVQDSKTSKRITPLGYMGIPWD